MTAMQGEPGHHLARAFRDFIRHRNFPCVGAKAALAQGQLRIIVGRDIRSGSDDRRIHATLLDLACSHRVNPRSFSSLAVLFEDGTAHDEVGFEGHLWARLASLSDKDTRAGLEPDPRVSDDPDDPHFSVSFGGEAFFVVGLHPQASRPARRFSAPALIFNLHDQFERLRRSGLYDKLRGVVLERDLALAGSPNPMLANHGASSEARQYSGRAVSDDWRCPFAGRNRSATDAA